MAELILPVNGWVGFPDTKKRGVDNDTPSHTLRLGCHLTAAFGAGSTSVDAFPHVTEPLAIIGAFTTYFRTFAADMLMVLGAKQHEMRCGSANFGAGQHQGKVLLLRVFSANLQTVSHCA